MRLTGPRFMVLVGFIGLGIVIATDQIVPATSAYQAQMRLWLAARASGIVCYLLLTSQIVLGLVLSHPMNQTTWKLSKRLFPWHENLWVFVLAFLGAHVVSLILDPYAGVGVAGTFIPGLSSYRLAGRAGHAGDVRAHRHRPDRPLYEAPTAGVLAEDPSREHRRLHPRLAARDAGRDRCDGAPPRLPLDRAGRPRSRRLSLLGEPQARRRSRPRSRRHRSRR